MSISEMIYPGTDLKFRVTTTQPDFQLAEDWFEIVIRDQYGRLRRTITKSDCFWDDQGNYYFVLDDPKRAVYFAYFHGRYEDGDYDDSWRDFTDAQELCRIGYKGGGCCGTRRETDGNGGDGHGCHCEHVVQYEQVWTVSVDGEDYLADKDGKYILTADGKRICFKSSKAQEIDDMGKVRLTTLTGEQFKQLIEGENPDGQIDTVPEMMRAAQGISDTETIQHDVDERIEDHDTENEASDDDIDSIFGDNEGSSSE